MMPFDTTAIGICISIIISIIFAFFEYYNKKDFEVTNIALVFLATFAVLAGIELIYAAILGDPNNLPSNWREYLSVAGMVGIGLSINFLADIIKKVTRKPEASKLKE